MGAGERSAMCIHGVNATQQILVVESTVSAIVAVGMSEWWDGR